MKNENINTDINRFDSRYLKCIVSKYPVVTEYLANSGAMIVLQDENDKIKNPKVHSSLLNERIKFLNELISKNESLQANINDLWVNDKFEDTQIRRNYIYLGNEFLASGYGVATKEIRQRLEDIAETYNETIAILEQNDISEAKSRNDKDNEIIRKFDDYVKINRGPIENTVITFKDIDGEDKPITTLDFITKYCEPAKYKDIEILKTIVKIKDLNGNTYTVNGNEIIFPLASVINQIEIEFDAHVNDTGGIRTLQVLHNLEITGYDYNRPNILDSLEGTIIEYNEDGDLWNYNNKIGQIIKYNRPVDNNGNPINELLEPINENNSNKDILEHFYEDRDTHKYKYVRQLFNWINTDTNFDFYLTVDKIYKNVIKEAFLYIEGTPVSKLKVYPRLKEQNINIISAQNTILPHMISLPLNITIYPQYYISWTFTPNDIYPNISDYIGSFISEYRYAPLNLIHKSKLTIIDINNESNNLFKINIAIPSIFTLNKVYTLFNDKKYNITGLTYIIKENITMPCPKSKPVDDAYYCVPCTIYEINIDKSLKNSSKISLYIEYNPYNENHSIVDAGGTILCSTRKTTSQIGNEYSQSQFNKFKINDEEFNNLYWINATNINDVTLLKNVLVAAHENGIDYNKQW